MDQHAIYTFLARQRYAVVSSLSPAGTVQSALVGIAVTPELEIVFDTLRSSRKYANLTAHGLCSVVTGWSGEQTVQLEGMALEAKVNEVGSHLHAYFAAWPDAHARRDSPDIAYFVVQPCWIRYSDYDQQPAFIAEFKPDAQGNFTTALEPPSQSEAGF